MDVRAGNRHIQDHLERPIDNAVAVDNSRSRVGPVRDTVDMSTHQLLGTGLQLGNCGVNGLDAIPVEQMSQPFFADTERAELRANIADALVSDADVVQHDVDDVLANLAAAD